MLPKLLNQSSHPPGFAPDFPVAPLNPVFQDALVPSEEALNDFPWSTSSHCSLKIDIEKGMLRGKSYRGNRSLG
jgi:hypothetical protein